MSRPIPPHLQRGYDGPRVLGPKARAVLARCGSPGCPHDAKWQVGLHVWSRFTAKATSEPFYVRVDLLACDLHKEHAGDARTLLQPALQRSINRQLRALKRFDADFATTEWAFKPLVEAQS